MATLPGLIVNLTLAHAQFTQGINQVNRQLGVLNQSVNVAKQALTGFLAGFGVQQLVALGKGALDAAGGMGDLAQQAGISAKQLQIFQIAAVQTGLSQENLVAGLSRLNVRLSNAERGTDNLSGMLLRYNISVKDAHGNTRATSDILGDFADVIQDTASQTERGGIAAELFGSRIGQKFLPLLSQGSEGLRDFGRQVEQAGLLLGDDFLADADAASDALATLQLALQRGFQIGVIGEFRDSVSSSIDAMREAKEAGEALGQIVGGALRAIAAAAETLVPLFQQLASEIDTISSAAQSLGDLAEKFTGDAVAVELLNEDIGSLNEQIADLIGRRRELESTGVGSERATAEINNQIEVFKRQREELIETRNQLQFVDTAEKDLGGTIPGTTAAIEEQIGRMAALAAQSKSAAVELKKLAAIDMADVQFEIGQQPLKRAQDEVATFEKKWKDTNENILRITEDFSQRANQVRHQANEEAAREHEAAAEEQLRFDRQKAQETADSIVQISEQTIQRGRQAARDAAEEDIRLREQLDKEAAAQRAQAAEAQADLMLEPFRNAIQGIQSATTALFEDILSGGIDSFEELAASIKQTFIKLAAELASLSLFRMLAGGGLAIGGAGAAMANPAGATMQMGAHGMLTGGGATSSLGAAAVGAPWWMAPNTSFGGLAVAGGLGALGGSMVGGMFGGQGQIGGGVGGGLGGALGMAVAGPIGGIVGAMGGSLLGGFIGGLFGGGSSGNEVSIGGGLGRAGAGGTGAAAKFVVGFDKKMSELLNDRQMKLAEQALRAAASVSVKYDKELSEGDMARLAAGRVVPVAGALGFRKQAFKGLGAEEGLAQLQEALQLEKTIQDLTKAVTPFKRAILDLREQFATTTARARELGISTRGMSSALREAEAQMRAQRDFERASLRLQLETIIAGSSAAKGLTVAIAGIRLQFDQLRESAEALGVPLALVNKAEKAAIQQARDGARAIERANRDAERAAAREAKQRRDEEKRQRAADKAAAKVFLAGYRMTGAGDFERERAAINASYREALKLAREYGLSEKGLSDIRKESVRALKRQTRAEADALAQSLLEPFKALSDPLRAFTEDLERSLLSPLELYKRSQADFRQTVQEAQGGDLDAINRLREEGQFYIEQAGRFGASPEQVAATEEVMAATANVTQQVDISMREASRGITEEVRRASNREIDSLDKLEAQVANVVKEIKRLRI